MHIDPEFIMQLDSMLNGCIADEDFTEEMGSAAAAYLLWSNKKKALYPDMPERYMFQKVDGEWSSPSKEGWTSPVGVHLTTDILNGSGRRNTLWCRTIHNAPAPIHIVCPGCGGLQTLYSSLLEGMLCFSCDLVFTNELMYEVLAQTPEDEPLHIRQIAAPSESNGTAFEDDEGFVTYDNK